MKVTLEDSGACRKVMHIKAEADEVGQEYTGVLAEFTKHARIPGFRQGKAPSKVIEKRLSKEIEDETKDRLIPKFYRQALQDNKIVPVSILGVNSVEFKSGKGMSFSVVIDVAPDIALPRYMKIALQQNEVAVSDKEVDEAYTRMMDSYAKYADVTTGRGIQDNDLVSIDYTGRCGDEPIEKIAPGNAGVASGKDFWTVIGAREMLPGLSAGLKGLKIGEKKDVTVSFPADYKLAAVAGKEAVYSVEVKTIREKTPPKVDAEFLKMFEVESEAALKEKIREQMLEEAKRAEKNRQFDEIAKYLLANTECPLPQSIVEEERNAMIRNVVERVIREGGSREFLQEKQKDILDSASKGSEERVKMSYILAKIAAEEKVEVSDEEVDARLDAMAAQYRMPPEKLRAEIEKRNGLEGLKSELRSEKTMNLLLENAKIK